MINEKKLPVKHYEEEQVSKKVIDEVFPNLDLADKDKTLAKVEELLSKFKECKNFYEKLSGDENLEDEELLETYDNYIEAIENILPEGYRLRSISSPRDSSFWRGTDPFIVLSLLSGDKNKLKISSQYPNIAKNWQTAIAYGKSSKSVDVPFVLTMGFQRPENLKILKSESSDIYKDTIETAEGEIKFNDLKEIAIRLKGKQPGEVFPPRFYRLEKIDEAMAA